MLIDWKGPVLVLNEWFANLTSRTGVAELVNETRISVVDLGYAGYKGISNLSTGVTDFYGIKYAQAPVGQLRWKAPVPLTVDNFIDPEITGNTTVPLIDATVPAPGCFSEQPYWGRDRRKPQTHAQQEDCLSLNIQTPVDASEDALLPVLVNIHGGGYLAGTNDVSGTFMIHESNNSIVYASINYRLGVYGFLGGKDVAEKGDLNVGLLDQRLALLWIKQNIAKFGGDPKRITITGDSAGGGSVTYQLAAYDGEPPREELEAGGGDQLFHAAYSAYPWWTPVWDRPNQETAYLKFLEFANCDDIECLRQLDEGKLREISTALQLDNSDMLQDGYGLFTFSPVVDGKFIKRKPHESFRTGKYLKVPLMLSRATQEGFGFTSPDLNQADQLAAYEEASEDFHLKFPTAKKNPGFLKEFERLYPVDEYASVFDYRQDWFQDAMINCPTYSIADYASSQGVPVYKFIFSTLSKQHGTPKFFIFSEKTEAPVFDKEGSKNLASYVVSFVKTGDPNQYKRQEALFWPPYFDGDDKFNAIDFLVKRQELIKDPDHRDQCEFFRAYANIISN